MCFLLFLSRLYAFLILPPNSELQKKQDPTNFLRKQPNRKELKGGPPGWEVMVLPDLRPWSLRSAPTEWESSCMEKPDKRSQYEV